MITLGEVAQKVLVVGAVTEHKQTETPLGTRNHTQQAHCRHIHSRTNTDAHTLLVHNCALIVINQVCILKCVHIHLCVCVLLLLEQFSRLDSQQRRSQSRFLEGPKREAERGLDQGPRGPN